MASISHIFLDLDGVLTDFYEASRKLIGNPPALEEHQWNFWLDWDIPSKQFWHEVEEAGEDFWANLKPYPWAADLIALISCFSGHTLATAPKLYPECYSGKFKWIRQFFGPSYSGLMIGEEKHLLQKKNSVLIDDGEENVERFEDGGGHAILFPQPWNSNRYLQDDRIGYVHARLKQIAEQINERPGGSSGYYSWSEARPLRAPH